MEEGSLCLKKQKASFRPKLGIGENHTLTYMTTQLLRMRTRLVGPDKLGLGSGP